MNNYQRVLYNNLMTLCEEREAFYYADQERFGEKFRIFNYRLSSYTDFCQPDARECRGIMYEIEGEAHDANPIRLAAIPMAKFFNLYENPFTMDLDLDDVMWIEEKADGSLISSYISSTTGRLCLKSKGSLASDQAIEAEEWLGRKENVDLNVSIYEITAAGYTVNMEWIGPTNRIVLNYPKSKLRILNVRAHQHGASVSKQTYGQYPDILDHWVEQVDFHNRPADFIRSIPDMVDIEGFVIHFRNEVAKAKTTWYLALHKTKDNVNSPRRLFEAVIEETTDDMKTLFHDDPTALKLIADMEKFVQEKFNHMVDTVERFYERNKHLDRKSYAILGQEELKGTMFFGLVMSKYVGKEFSYKSYLKGKWKQLGLKDEVNEG